MTENKTQQATKSNRGDSRAAGIVDNLFDVGEAWASYGLKIAELAVATSARTLDNVSKALGTLSESLKKDEKKDVIDAPAA